MNILLITHEYYPIPSAITNCLKPILSELKIQNTIYILTRNENNLLKDTEVLDSINVIRINDKYAYLLKKREESRNIIEKFYYKVCFHIFYKNRKKNLTDGYFDIKKMVKFGRRLIKQRSIDLIISCSFPFTSHEIAKKLKRKGVKWIAYQFDPYTYNYTLMNDGKEKERLKKEIDILRNADKVFITQENYQENMKTELSKLSNKYIIFPYPLVSKPNYPVTNSNEEIMLSFAGTLYENIREPFKMLDILSHLQIPVVIHLYYSSDLGINNKLKKYQAQMPNLKLHYKKTKQECDQALASTNFCLNIGNIMLNQTPSKVFELISLGKPIINFYTNIKDTSKSILKDYPICYNVDMNSFNQYRELEKFILENKNKILSFEKATLKYLKKEEVVEQMMKEVERVYEDR